MRYIRSIAVGLLAGVASAGGAQPVAPPVARAAALCDRACLKQALDGYLTAVLKHDPAAASLAANYRGTENAIVVAPGQGAWSGLTALGTVQRRYVDPVTSQAAYFGDIAIGGKPGVATVRIKVMNGKVADAEWIYALQGETMVSLEGFAANPPPVETVLPAAKRSTRAQLMSAADSYFEALERHDGSGVPKVKGCPRVESGTRVTGRRERPGEANGPAVEFDAGDCADNLQRMTQIDRVIGRRYPVVDEEAGVVLGYGLFLRPPGAKRQDGTEWPRLLLSEVFTADAGRISGIYAAMRYQPADLPATTGW